MSGHTPSLQLVPDAPPRALEALADDELMLAVKAGRKDAFAVLIKRHQELVLGFASRYLADRSLGRDVAQDVFLALWAERDRYRTRGKFRSFLFTMTKNRCHLVARQRRTGRDKLEDLGADPSRRKSDPHLPIQEVIAAERARAVQEKLTELPDKVRQVLILRYTHDLPLEEIAGLTGMPLGTVKSHVHRGLGRLGQLLGQGAP